MDGGAGNGDYVFGADFDQDTLYDYDSTTGNIDEAILGEGVGYSQLWFRHVGNNLEASLIGTGNKVTLQN
jgi:hypothetical protein